MKTPTRFAVAAAGMVMTLGGISVAAAPAYACAPYGPAGSSGSSCGPSSGQATVASVIPVSQAAVASGSTDPTARSSALAFTGADVTVASVIGAGAIAGGGLLVLASRRRRQTS